MDNLLTIRRSIDNLSNQLKDGVGIYNSTNELKFKETYCAFLPQLK